MSNTNPVGETKTEILPGSIKCDGSGQVKIADLINAIHILEAEVAKLKNSIDNPETFLPWKTCVKKVNGEDTLFITTDGSNPPCTSGIVP